MMPFMRTEQTADPVQLPAAKLARGSGQGVTEG